VTRTRSCSDSELRDRIAAVLRLDAANYTTAREFFERNSNFFFSEPRQEYKRHADDRVIRKNLSVINKAFVDVPSEQWDEAHLKQAFHELVEDLSNKLDNDYAPDFDDPTKGFRIPLQRFLRWALVGGRPGVTLMATMVLLGRDVSLQRIEDAVAAAGTLLAEETQA